MHFVLNKLAAGLVCFLFTIVALASEIPTSVRAENAINRVKPQLQKALQLQNLSYGAPIFIRIFKQSSELEVWLQASSGKYQLFKTYPICYFSGELGPKTQEGDLQSPEGFYFVNAGRLNPWSRFHLSFNLGYPNQYDRSKGYTGSALMIHGDCVSIGCYAMTDDYINEIYTLAFAALAAGQPFFRVHIFPFKLDDKALGKYKDNTWYEFWKNLQEGYKHFEVYKRPPNVSVKKGRYSFAL